MSLTVLGGAVLVRVITAEEHARLVGVDHAVIPSDRLRSRAVTEVLLNELRLVSISEEMVLGMLSKLDSLIQSIGQLATKSRVARLMDRVFLGPALSPVVSVAGLGRLSSRLGLAGLLPAKDGSGSGGSEEQDGRGGRLEHHLEGGWMERLVFRIVGSSVVEMR